MSLPASPSPTRRSHVALAALVLAGLYHAASAPPVQGVSSTVTISEFRVRGPNGGSDEFVELYNLSAAPVSIGGWKVKGSNNAAGTSTRATITAGTMLAPGCHYLLTNSSTSGGPYSGPVPGNQTYATGITDDGGIALTLANDTIVDQVGMSAGSAFKEGTPLASLGSSNQNRGYERKPGGAAGSSTDTDNNSADFQLVTPSDPQNLSSPCVVVGDPSGVGAANPASLPPGDQTLLTVTVTPGSNPASTGITVTGDLTGIGGSATQPFFDDGTNGDATSGDNVFSFLATVPFATTPGARSLPTAVADAQGRTASAPIALTIESPPVAIHEIQGPGNASPLTGSTVSTIGIVTARKNNAFFIQAPDADADGDPQTSEGIAVFTGGAPPAAAAVGNEVRVRGTVQEFIPSQDPGSPPLTELSGALTVTLLSTGNPLPAAIVVTAADASPSGTLEQLERFEGMRVQVASLTVVAPTQAAFVNEPSATSTTNGVFYGVMTGTPRPFREPGIEVPDPLPPGSPCCIPRFDGNPERLRVDSDGQPGAVPLEVTTGAVVTGLVGPLDYSFRTYTILPDPSTPPVATGNVSATPVPVAAPDELTVASFNMERFFDTANDPNTGEPVLTTAAFERRLSKASLAIRNVLRTPDVIGVVEMENLSTLETVASRVNADSVAAGDPDPAYLAYLEEGNDIGGIDVGFLVKSARVDVVDVTQEGKDETFVNPNNGLPELLNDRPSLVLRADVNRPGGTPFPITVIVNHLRSLNGVDDPADGNRVRTKRRAQAEFLAGLIQSRQAADPGEHIILVGDFNAFQFNDGYVDGIGTIKGMPTPADEVVLASGDLVDPDLTELVDTVAPEERYSFVFDGNAQELDHVLLAANLLDRLRGLHYARANADFPESFRNDAARPERLSDHDMPVVYFSFPPEADLSLTKTASPEPALTGSAVTYALTVTNAGPDAAADVVVSDTLSAGTTFQSVSTPAGWTCTTPPVGGTGTVSCMTPSVAIGSASLSIVAGVDCALPNGTLISNTATVTSTTSDPTPGGESASASVTASNPPPAISGLTADPSVLWPPNHKMVLVTLTYGVTDNCDPAPVCTLDVTSNEPVNGDGDGDTAPDWNVVDPHHVQLRAERAGGGNGRIYTLTVTCTDVGGASSQATTTVTVPKNKP